MTLKRRILIVTLLISICVKTYKLAKRQGFLSKSKQSDDAVVCIGIHRNTSK